MTNQTESQHFTDIQRAFAAHIREPDLHPRPTGIEDRRMQIYRELFYNNIEGFISNSFPIVRKLYTDKDWHQMVRDFFHRHQSHTPYFLEISEEFLAYLDDERERLDIDPPFLLELARYEWAELALYVAEEVIPKDNLPANASLLDHVPMLSPLAWSFIFSYPVHKIGPSYTPSEPENQPICLVVYRDRQDQVGFLEANMVTARLIELCDGNSQRKGVALLEQIAAEMKHPDPSIVINGGGETLAQLHHLNIIVGMSGD